MNDARFVAALRGQAMTEFALVLALSVLVLLLPWPHGRSPIEQLLDAFDSWRRALLFWVAVS